MRTEPGITYFRNPSESALAELISKLIINSALSVVGIFIQASMSMLRQFRRPTRNLFAAWLCGCWVALTFAMSIVPAQYITERASTVDCVSAAAPTSAPYSDTSIDESSLRLAQAAPKIGYIGHYLLADSETQQRTFGSSAPVLRGLGCCQPTLLDLGIALRL